jgi:hypothetical protein
MQGLVAPVAQWVEKLVCNHPEYSGAPIGVFSYDLLSPELKRGLLAAAAQKERSSAPKMASLTEHGKTRYGERVGGEHLDKHTHTLHSQLNHKGNYVFITHLSNGSLGFTILVIANGMIVARWVFAISLDQRTGSRNLRFITMFQEKSSSSSSSSHGSRGGGRGDKGGKGGRGDKGGKGGGGGKGRGGGHSATTK